MSDMKRSRIEAIIFCCVYSMWSNPSPKFHPHGHAPNMALETHPLLRWRCIPMDFSPFDQVEAEQEDGRKRIRSLLRHGDSAESFCKHLVSTPVKINMEPKCWWFVDVSTFPMGYFQVPR